MAPRTRAKATPVKAASESSAAGSAETPVAKSNKDAAVAVTQATPSSKGKAEKKTPTSSSIKTTPKKATPKKPTARFDDDADSDYEDGESLAESDTETSSSEDEASPSDEEFIAPDSDEEVAPSKSKKKKATVKASDSEEEATPSKSKKKKAIVKASDSDEEATPSKNKKKKAIVKGSDSEDEAIPSKSKKKKVPVPDFSSEGSSSDDSSSDDSSSDDDSVVEVPAPSKTKLKKPVKVNKPKKSDEAREVVTVDEASKGKKARATKKKDTASAAKAKPVKRAKESKKPAKKAKTAVESSSDDDSEVEEVSVKTTSTVSTTKTTATAPSKKSLLDPGFKDALALKKRQVVYCPVGKNMFRSASIIIYVPEDKAHYTITQKAPGLQVPGAFFYGAFNDQGALVSFSGRVKVPDNVKWPEADPSWLIVPYQAFEIAAGIAVAGIVLTVDAAVERPSRFGGSHTMREITILAKDKTDKKGFQTLYLTLWGELTSTEYAVNDVILAMNAKQSVFQNVVRFSLGDQSSIIVISSSAHAKELRKMGKKFLKNQAGGTLVLPAGVKAWDE